MNQNNNPSLAPSIQLETIQPKNDIAGLTGNVISFLIFIVAAISIVATFISLIIGIIFSANKSKAAKYAWISTAVSVLVFVLCILGFTVITVLRNVN